MRLRVSVALPLYVNDDPNDPMIYFTTNPSLNRILRDQSNSIGLVEVTDYVRGAITSCFTESSRNVPQLDVSIFPRRPEYPRTILMPSTWECSGMNGWLRDVRTSIRR